MVLPTSRKRVSKEGFSAASRLAMEAMEAFVIGLKPEVLLNSVTDRGCDVQVGEHVISFRMNPEGHLWRARVGDRFTISQGLLLKAQTVATAAILGARQVRSPPK